MSKPTFCGDCKHPAHSGPCSVLHLYDRPGGYSGNQQCLCGHPYIPYTITTSSMPDDDPPALQATTCPGCGHADHTEQPCPVLVPPGNRWCMCGHLDSDSAPQAALDLEKMKALCEEEFFGGSRVVNCLSHSSRPLTERPDNCALCLSDLRNHLLFCIRVNEWLNTHWDQSRTAMPALIHEIESLRARVRQLGAAREQRGKS